jgi:UDP-N-acetylglucosamine 2-epimerase
MADSYLVMTDSGGIQEAVPSLKILVLVVRNQRAERREKD